MALPSNWTDVVSAAMLPEDNLYILPDEPIEPDKNDLQGVRTSRLWVA